jgi:hypothetical protein
MQFNKSIISFVKGVSSVPTHSDDIYLYNDVADERFRYINYLGQIKTLATTDDTLGVVVDENGGFSSGRYVETIGNSGNTVFTINHDLGTEDVVVSVREISTNEIVYPSIDVQGVNSINVIFGVAPVSETYSVTVLGPSLDIASSATLASISGDLQGQIDQKLDTTIFAALSGQGGGGGVTESQLAAVSGNIQTQIDGKLDTTTFAALSGGGDFLPLAGGTMSGPITMGSNELRFDDSQIRIVGGSDTLDFFCGNKYITLDRSLEESITFFRKLKIDDTNVIEFNNGSTLQSGSFGVSVPQGIELQGSTLFLNTSSYIEDTGSGVFLYSQSSQVFTSDGSSMTMDMPILMNGNRVGEVLNVDFNAQGSQPTNGGLWVNSGDNSIYFDSAKIVLEDSDPTFNSLTVSNDLSVGGNLTVSGTTTTIDTQQVLIEDNIITLNSNLTGTPPAFLNGGIEVNRGNETNAVLIWDESSSSWVAGLSGSETQIGDFKADGSVTMTGNLNMDVWSVKGSGSLILESTIAGFASYIILDAVSNDSANWKNTYGSTNHVFLGDMNFERVVLTISGNATGTINEFTGGTGQTITLQTGFGSGTIKIVKNASANVLTISGVNDTTTLLAGESLIAYYDGATWERVDVFDGHTSLSESISGSSQVLDSLSESEADLCEWLVSIKDGTNYRASRVLATWDGNGNVVYNETSTTDIGDTSDAVLSVGQNVTNIQLLLTSTQTWNIKTKRTDL